MHDLLFKRGLLLILTLGISCISLSQVVINELVALNFSAYEDRFDQFWPCMELFNNGEEELNLDGWELVSDQFANKKIVLPKIVIVPKSFVVLVFSGRNRVVDNEVHVSESLSELIGNFKLIDAQSAVNDTLSLWNLQVDNGYGYRHDGGGFRVEFDGSSIGTSNNNTELYTPLTETLFMAPFGGFYPQDSIEATILVNGNDLQVYYTLDGTVPTPSSILYEGPFFIKDGDKGAVRYATIKPVAKTLPGRKELGWKSPSKPIRKAVVLKAAVFKNSIRVSDYKTATYFVGENSKLHTLPVFSIVSHPDNLFGGAKGLLVPGDNREVNTQETWFEEGGNFNLRGPKWERPAFAELFDGRGEIAWKMKVGLRVHGYASRNYAQKSLRFYARDFYENNRLNYPFFEQRTFSDYKHILLRNSGQDILRTMFADALATAVIADLNIDYQEHQAAVHYINGEYWGITNIRDRISERFVAYLHPNVNQDLVHIVSISSEKPDGGEGAYKVVRDFVVSQSNMNSVEVNAYINKHVDIPSFIDYQLAKIAVGSYDWPGNNVRIWWENKPDFKLRWIAYDTDEAFSTPVDRNTLLHAIEKEREEWPNPASSTLFFRKLLENDSFKSAFIQRSEYVIEHMLAPERLLSIIDSFENIYEPEMQQHIDRWEYIPDLFVWKRNVEVFRNFARKRACYMKQHFCEVFDLDETLYLPNLNCSHLSSEKQVEMELIGNPSVDFFEIKVLMNAEHPVFIKVFDPLGKLIYDERRNALKGTNIYPVRVREQSKPGFYSVVVHGRKFKVAQKWLRLAVE